MKNVGSRPTSYKRQQFLTGSCNFVSLLFGYSIITRQLLVQAAFHEIPN